MKTVSSNPGELQAIILDDVSAEDEHNLRVERRISHLRDRHWTILILATVALLLSFLLSFNEEGTESSLSLGSMNMPPMCGSRMMFGIDCPGCGLTRSFVAIASGDIVGSLQFHRIGWLMWLATVLQFPYRIYCLRELRGGLVERRWPTWFGNFMIVALIGNWLLIQFGW